MKSRKKLTNNRILIPFCHIQSHHIPLQTYFVSRFILKFIEIQFKLYLLLNLFNPYTLNSLLNFIMKTHIISYIVISKSIHRNYQIPTCADWTRKVNIHSQTDPSPYCVTPTVNQRYTKYQCIVNLQWSRGRVYYIR